MRWREADATLDESATAADRIVAEVVGTTRALRDNELFVRIVELDPELLLPYLLTRRGRSQEAIAELTAGRLREGQADGSVRKGDPVAIARALLLAAHGFVLSAHTMVDDEVGEDDLDRELEHLVRSVVGAMSPASGPGLADVPTEVDVLVVGLGITGAGCALDAVSRGLSVLAVDAHDLAFGTSRWSSKLVHGGLRYLANGQVGVAHESAVERGILMEVTAPHLTHALPMLLPLDARHRPPPGRVPARRDRRRRPAPRRRPHLDARPFLGLAGSPPPRAATSRRSWARASAAASCRGTASSRTTPGWSPPSPAPRPPSAPRSAPALAPLELHGRGAVAARRADRSDRTRSARPRRGQRRRRLGRRPGRPRRAPAESRAPTSCSGPRRSPGCGSP